jgi:hypothetical protein
VSPAVITSVVAEYHTNTAGAEALLQCTRRRQSQ